MEPSSFLMLLGMVMGGPTWGGLSAQCFDSIFGLIIQLIGLIIFIVGLTLI